MPLLRTGPSALANTGLLGHEAAANVAEADAAAEQYAQHPDARLDGFLAGNPAESRVEFGINGVAAVSCACTRTWVEKSRGGGHHVWVDAQEYSRAQHSNERREHEAGL